MVIGWFLSKRDGVMLQDEDVRHRRYGKLGNSLALDGVGIHGTGAHGNWGMGNTALGDWSTI